MRNKTQNPRNLNRNQLQDNTPKQETRGKDSIQLTTAKKTAADCTGNATDEAIDVLSFMGFKL